MSRRTIWVLGQTGLSVGLLAYLFSRIDIAQAWHVAVGAQPLLLTAAVAQLGLQLGLAALRWQIVAAALGARLSFGLAFRFVWIGTFFSQALPASVGGDAVRIWLYWKQSRNHRIAIQSVVLERIVMVMALLALVVAVQPGLAARGAPATIVVSVVLLLTGMIAALGTLIALAPVLSKRQHWLPVKMICAMAADVRALLRARGIAPLGLLSIAAHLNMAVTAWLIAQALALPLTLADCIVLMPVIVLVAMLPISLGGWGVRETAAVTVLGLAGIGNAGALALSVLIGLTAIAVSVPGALFWVVLKRRPSTVELMEATGANDEPVRVGK